MESLTIQYLATLERKTQTRRTIRWSFPPNREQDRGHAKAETEAGSAKHEESTAAETLDDEEGDEGGSKVGE